MIGGFVPKKPHRHVIELQLTAMIDIFSMLVIFLIKGTVFGAAAIDVPKNIRPPLSLSKESVDSAPQLAIGAREVRISTQSQAIPIDAFRRAASEDPRITKLKVELKEYVGKLSKEARSSGVLLNVVADRAAPYQDIFDTVRVFREAGFETLLFVAVGPGDK
jgi:biopolymer transport protein ExbD